MVHRNTNQHYLDTYQNWSCFRQVFCWFEIHSRQIVKKQMEPHGMSCLGSTPLNISVLGIANQLNVCICQFAFASMSQAFIKSFGFVPR